MHAEIFNLGVVEVTAKDESVSSPNVSVVNKKSIQINNAKTVSDVAKFVPGVSLRGGAYARNETSMSIRGFGSTQIPVYIDGIPVYVPYDGNMDLSRFTTYDLSRIDISKGASSVLYGPNALGGAINIVSLKPTRELEASLGYGARAGVKSKAYYDKFKNSLHNMSDSNFNQSAPGKRGFKSKYNDYTYVFGFEVGANIGENNILKFAPSYKRDVHRESDIGVPVQRYEDETLSLALEHTYFFSDRTNLTTGISYDSRKAIKAEYLRHTCIGERS
nr:MULTISPECIES: TonB-dependent receptor [unclassified Campylobacter]